MQLSPCSHGRDTGGDKKPLLLLQGTRIRKAQTEPLLMTVLAPWLEDTRVQEEV